MITDNTYTIPGKYARFTSVVCAFLIILGGTFFLYTDLRYYSFYDTKFSIWQIPVSVFLIFLVWLNWFYCLLRKQHAQLIILSVIWGIAIICLPYPS